MACRPVAGANGWWYRVPAERHCMGFHYFAGAAYRALTARKDGRTAKTLRARDLWRRVDHAMILNVVARPGNAVTALLGALLGVTSPALKDGVKVEFLPQWKERGQRDTVLSKRSLLVDMGMSDIQLDDVISTVDLLDKLREGSDTYRATQFL